MDKQSWVNLTGIGCAFLLVCLHTCHSELDCTGVDCPVLENCIEEVLEDSKCCATCLQRGCTCEGYQYYDCINEGFKNGKVPEGRSYLVDLGSTECSCPMGGGKIGCHFIPCPEIPPNCIDLSESSEGCPHCLRIGCIYRGQKYEAGHSFHMDPCQVCHCPTDGGKLMCSPIPNCDPGRIKEPSLPSGTEDHRNELQAPKHEVPADLPTKHHTRSASNSLPVYTDSPSEFDEMEDYDYFPETASTAKSEGSPSPGSPEAQSSQEGLEEDTRKELREVLGTYDVEEPTGSPFMMVPTSTAPPEDQATSGKGLRERPSEPEAAEGRTIQTEDPLLSSRSGTHSFREEEEREEEEEEEEARNSVHHTHRHRTPHRGTGEHGRHSDTVLHSISPKMQVNPTISPDIGLKKQGTPRPSQTMFQKVEEATMDLHPEPQSQGVFSREILSVCCEAGKKWASTHGHCTNMKPTRMDPISMCWTAQTECCLGSVRESKCSAGLSAARSGRTCEADGDDVCGADSYKECCSCCALGLRLRQNGGQCEALQFLGHVCSHALRTCCQGPDTANRSVIRERTHPQPTVPPRRVSDSPDRQAMSLDEVGESENTVENEEEIEGRQDVDECAVYEGQLCQQQCINIPGSYTCACYEGYTLQPDGIHCLKVTSEEENRLPTIDSNPDEIPTPPPAAQPDPCEGNGPCAHRCSPVAGHPLCSCFPGFSLLVDGHTCEDVDECVLSTHTCQTNERCINTVGHFTCERLIVCPAGFQLRRNVCEDMNECTLGTHNCGAGFDCVNTLGSFSCRARLRCPGGFTHDTLGQCVDIDECRTVSQPCTSGFNCVNTIGSYTCQRKIIMCGRGYHASPDGTRCTDVDECQTGVHRCEEGQLCHNLPGTYRCDCQTGYQYDMFRRMCVDVNECWRYPGRLCAQTCENTPGSYHCSCSSGFSLSSDGKNCEDVNECLNSPCSQECANIYGSFQCYCKQGYYLREDGLTCEDIDECSQRGGHLCAFKCVNVPGSYQCSCPEHGYSMSPNGRSCRDIDECGLGAHNCTMEETCYNIQGGFRCLSFSCPPNYRRVSDTRCERVSCANFGECQNIPLRITYYQLTFQTNVIVPAQIFRIGPSPAYSGDNIIISITRGNEEGYFSTRKLNAYTGAIYLHRQIQHPRDFLLDVEMKLWRQGTFTTFLAKIYVFITPNIL